MPSEEKVHVWLVEDDDRFRAGIKALVDENAGLICDLAVASCEDALEHLESDAAPDILLMDVGLPGQLVRGGAVL